jgi:hypothetical protein
VVRTSNAVPYRPALSLAPSSIRQIVLSATAAAETILLAQLDCRRLVHHRAMDPPAAVFLRRQSRLPRFSVADVGGTSIAHSFAAFSSSYRPFDSLIALAASAGLVRNESGLVSVTKAAAISSAMLARKSSYQKGRESLGLLADILTDEQAEAADTSQLLAANGPCPTILCSVARKRLDAEYSQVRLLPVHGVGVGEYAGDDQMVVAAREGGVRRRQRHHTALHRGGSR